MSMNKQLLPYVTAVCSSVEALPARSAPVDS